MILFLFLERKVTIMPALKVSDEHIEKISSVLLNVNKPLKERFRALFTLKNIGSDKCIKEIAKGFTDSSALLKHELAYCLGQMQNEKAIPELVSVLEDDNQETIVRHEAGEAIGAIGSKNAIALMQKYARHSLPEIAETCQLALDRIDWLHNQQITEEFSENPYNSVDPAPPITGVEEVDSLVDILMNEEERLFKRYKALFKLRNISTPESIKGLCKGFSASSALFRHEIAFVLGQIADPVSTQALITTLKKSEEHPMVRHECAEALGAIATPECFEILKEYSKDNERVVRESCDIALDMCEYENSDQFQYADGLQKIDGS